jgi:hypothetical protein
MTKKLEVGPLLNNSRVLKHWNSSWFDYPWILKSFSIRTLVIKSENDMVTKKD